MSIQARTLNPVGFMGLSSACSIADVRDVLALSLERSLEHRPEARSTDPG